MTGGTRVLHPRTLDARLLLAAISLLAGALLVLRGRRFYPLDLLRTQIVGV
jgi:hypothetical protein